MQFSSKILEDAVMALSGLPGIGKKTALRLALHLSADKHQKSLKIAEALTVLHNDIKTCKKCFNLSDTEVCGICLLYTSSIGSSVCYYVLHHSGHSISDS